MKNETKPNEVECNKDTVFIHMKHVSCTEKWGQRCSPNLGALDVGKTLEVSSYQELNMSHQ